MIYLDHNATTPLDPRVLEAMLPYLKEHFGNPSSAHALGRMPEAALQHAREQVAGLLGGQPSEVVFTSGGTEGITHVFRGVFERLPDRRHVITTAVEHSATRAAVAWLKAQGAAVTVLGVDAQGRLDLDELRAAFRPDTGLVSIMAANNETGVCHPMETLAGITRAQGCLFHTDAVQMAGKMPLRLGPWGVDLACISAHKFNGPKGAGALFIRRGVRLGPLILGGQQERGRRGGTENVPALVGMGAAAEQALAGGGDRLAGLRERLESGLLEKVPEICIHGREAERVPNTTLAGFRGVEGEALLLRLNEAGICVSTGSACTTGQKEPSHVLQAMGVPLEMARGTIRISLGRATTDAEIDRVLEVLPDAVAGLRQRTAMGR